jgi:methylmalonyl-CoA/ethylmalonyl-CoA epimerase
MTDSNFYKSLGLPPIDQIGFVVRDLDAWIARYDALFGPFSRIDGSVAGAQYRGRSEDVKLAIGFGRSGDLEIEFIEWREGQSPHREFIDKGREGMHHVRFRVEDCDGWIEKMRTVGFEPIWYKQWDADTVFTYMERPGDPTLIEFLQMPQHKYNNATQ